MLRRRQQQRALQPEAEKKATGPVGNPLEASAYKALNAGRLDEAERLFQQILEKEPNNQKALSGMGYVYMKRQEFGRPLTTCSVRRLRGPRVSLPPSALHSSGSGWPQATKR